MVDAGDGDEFELDIGILFLVGAGDRCFLVRVAHHTQRYRAFGGSGGLTTCSRGFSSCGGGARRRRRGAGYDHHAGGACAGDAQEVTAVDAIIFHLRVLHAFVQKQCLKNYKLADDVAYVVLRCTSSRLVPWDSRSIKGQGSLTWGGTSASPGGGT